MTINRGFVALGVLLVSFSVVAQPKIENIFEDRKVCTAKKDLCLFGTLQKDNKNRLFYFDGKVLFSKKDGKAVLNLQSKSESSWMQLGVDFRVEASDRPRKVRIVARKGLKIISNRDWKYVGLKLRERE